MKRTKKSDTTGSTLMLWLVACLCLAISFGLTGLCGCREAINEEVGPAEYLELNEWTADEIDLAVSLAPALADGVVTRAEYKHLRSVYIALCHLHTLLMVENRLQLERGTLPRRATVFDDVPVSELEALQ